MAEDLTVYARLRLLKTATTAVLTEALAVGDNRVALQAIRIYQSQLELESTPCLRSFATYSLSIFL